MHSAKGLEWTAAHLLHAVDSALRSDMAAASDDGLEEEQRLFYVAVTRARDHLTIYTPQRMPTGRTLGARHVLAKPSRFLTDAARGVCDSQEPVGQPQSTTHSRTYSRIEIPTLEELFR